MLFVSRSAVCLLALFLGCGSEAPQRVPVSGKVLIDGKPLTHGVVKVMPDGARPSMGNVDENGAFTLTAQAPGDGVTLGEHPVEIFAIKPVNGSSQWRYVPSMYEDHTTSNLKVNIPGPTDNLVIHLTWKGSGQKGPYLEKTDKE